MNAEQVDGQGKRERGARKTRARRPPLGPPRQAQAQNGPTIFSLEEAKKSGLRPIVIDAANVAHAHGKHSEFSGKSNCSISPIVVGLKRSQPLFPFDRQTIN